MNTANTNNPVRLMRIIEIRKFFFMVCLEAFAIGRLGEGCETPVEFRSKLVRVFTSIGHQTGNCKFLEVGMVGIEPTT